MAATNIFVEINYKLKYMNNITSNKYTVCNKRKSYINPTYVTYVRITYINPKPNFPIQCWD